MLSSLHRQSYCSQHQVVQEALSGFLRSGGSTSRTLLLACSTHLWANILTAAFLVLGSRSRNPHLRILSRLPMLRIRKSPISFILREYIQRRLIASTSLARSIMNKIVDRVCSRLNKTALRTSLLLDTYLGQIRAWIMLKQFDQSFCHTNPGFVIARLESCQSNHSLNAN